MPAKKQAKTVEEQIAELKEQIRAAKEKIAELKRGSTT